MDNSLSFFRVFDLAFFAPGMLLFGAMEYSGYFSDFSCYTASSQDGAVHNILVGAFAVVVIYVLGLICHGIQRGFREIKWRLQRQAPEPHWYIHLNKDKPAHELTLYFWYLSSTCWNLMIAVVLSILLFVFRDKTLSMVSAVVGILFVIGVLAFLGYEFERSRDEAAN